MLNNDEVKLLILVKFFVRFFIVMKGFYGRFRKGLEYIRIFF